MGSRFAEPDAGDYALSGPETLRRRYLISGHVQGVGYRYFTLDAALRHRLNGFARNLSDGRVEVVVDGDHNRLTEFRDELREGPPNARVTGVEVVEMPPESWEDPSFDSFTIRETR